MKTYVTVCLSTGANWRQRQPEYFQIRCYILAAYRSRLNISTNAILTHKWDEKKNFNLFGSLLENVSASARGEKKGAPFRMSFIWRKLYTRYD